MTTARRIRLYLRGKTWWVQVANTRRSTGCEDETLARIWVAGMERREAVINMLREDPLLRESIESYIDDVRAASHVGHVYGIRAGDKVKLGFTCRPPDQRLRQLQTGHALKLELVALMKGTRADEKHLHEKCRHGRVTGEWFRADDPEVMKWIRKHARCKNGSEKSDHMPSAA